MYDFLTAFVSIGVIAFLTIYNTTFLAVVTLGGTVLGCALLGFGSAFLALVLRRLTCSCPVRCCVEMTGCGFIIVNTVKYLPGWEMRPEPATMLFLLVLCFVITILNEYILEEKKRK